MYVDAIHDKSKNEINVVERLPDGSRKFETFPANYVLYWEDPRGKHKTMWGKPCKKYVTTDYKKFNKELETLKADGKKIHEHDINPIFRCLHDHYLGLDLPKLNIGFFDIEVDFDPKRGFAGPWEKEKNYNSEKERREDRAFSKITAISLYTTFQEKLVTLVLKPDLPKDDKDYLTFSAAADICDTFENCILCSDEKEMLNRFLDLIVDVDILSGWNSTGFDIPYIINRIERVLSLEDTKKMCLWDRYPRKREYIKFKKLNFTYDLVGRVHLDYLDLFRKHNSQELHSYRLDYVGEVTVGENKVPYEGSLDTLYKRDFKKFIEYNRQDTMLLVKIDKKCRYIELANQLAHTNSVLLQTTMGAVALIEQAIVNETWLLGMQVPSRKTEELIENDDDDDEEDEEDEFDDTGDKPVVGAYVADPKIGIQEFIGCCDINSLYPSTLRALNMGPETLCGQIRSYLTDEEIENRYKAGVKKPFIWKGIYNSVEYGLVETSSDKLLTIDFVDGDKIDTIEIPAKELRDMIFKTGSNICITANGTLFRTDVQAVIPGLLSKWYTERKSMQKKSHEFLDQANAESDPEKKRKLMSQYEFWDQRQHARKILLNSLYGAILNAGCRFYDQRIGQSVTLTGRSIARHMNSKINEFITGTYQIDGNAIIYADTDSSYFSASCAKDDPAIAEILADRDKVIEFYDFIGDEVNKTFASFMNEKFNTGLERGGVIRAGRELVASRGLFIKKKKYAVLIFDKEGTRYDLNGKPGKIKAMGLDLKRADTPQMMQKFLEEILIMILTGSSREEISQEIKIFRNEFRALKPWMKGTPKKVNGISGFRKRLDNNQNIDGLFEKLHKKKKKQNEMIPGHVMAALNWNKLLESNNDHYSSEIQDGAKVIVCKLRPNYYKITSIAYPIDQVTLPDWFKELPFDDELMEYTIIDKKIDNLIGVLNWDLSDSLENSAVEDVFSFGD